MKWPTASALALALALLPASPAAVLGQSDRTGPVTLALADSLAGVTDSSALLRVESQLIEYARVHRDDVHVHVRLGFVALRLGDLAGAGHYEDAASEFEWALELDDTEALPWYGLGQAELALVPEFYSSRLALQEMMGRSPLDKAALAFRTALAREPDFAPAARGLGEVALTRRLEPGGDGAVEALRALPPAALDAQTLLMRGRVERRFGSLDSATALFERAGALRGMRGLALLELARTALAAADTVAGAAAYYSGARFDDSLTVTGYRDDLWFIADPEDLATFDTLRGAERATWLEAFWSARSALGLWPEHARLAEHYRRLREAELTYRMPPFRRRYGFGEYFTPSTYEFDDRGVVFVRHGYPSASLRSARCSSEVWMYLDADPAFTSVFISEGMDDYRLVPSVLDLGFCAVEEFAVQRGPVGALVNRMGNQPEWRRNEMFVQGKADMLTATATESHRRRFAFRMPLSGHAVATALPGRGGVLHVATALPWRALEEAGYGPDSDLRLRVSVLGPDGEVVSFRDQRVRAIPGGTVATFYGEVRVPVGPVLWRLGMALGDSIGAELPVGQTVVPDAAGGNLELSDLVLGWARTGVSWSPAPGDTAWMNPLGVLPAGETLDVYYEAYGLIAGERYGGEIVVWRLEDDAPARIPPAGDGAELRVRFDESASGPVTRIVRTVDLGKLRPGRYGVAVVIQDELDRPTMRVSEIRIE